MNAKLAPIASLCFWATLVACSDGDVAIDIRGADSGSLHDTSVSDVAEVSDASFHPVDAGADVDAYLGPVDELVAVSPPPRPERPATIGILTVTTRTADATAAGTDDGVAYCANDNDCYGLNVPDIDDREPGQTDVFHVRPNGLAAADVVAMTIKTTSTDPNNNRWSPACIDVRVDGEPVYCNDAIPVHIGTGSSTNEVSSWTDPMGLASTCVSCAGSYVTHGPLIGPPDATSVRIWVRTDATRLTGLRMGHSQDLSDAPVVAWSWPRAEDDFTTDLVVEGLKPDTEYFWRVEVEGDTSQPVRRVRTAPEVGQTKPFRLAFGSCSRDQEQPIFDAISASQPDVFLFVGDTNYANTHYREALRWHYRNFRGIPERARLVANTPTMATWDDHDFLANNSNGTCIDRDEALAAFKEYWANAMHGLPEAPGAYSKSQYGAVDFFLLDCRMYRPDVGDPAKRCEPDPNPPNLSLAGGPLGPVQEGWLFNELKASQATFKFVACGSRFTPEGSLDSWAAFDAASARLRTTISAEGIEGVVFLSGDIHRSLFTTVETSSYTVPEIVSSPLANTPSNCGTSDPQQTECYDATPSWVQIDVDPSVADPTLTTKILDVTGQTQATWTIRRSELQ